VILADTSVWVDHLRHGNAVLARRLEDGVIAAHPFVLGELACGHIRRRSELLDLIDDLPSLPQTSHAEAMHLLHARALMGRGLGWIDVHLLAACIVGGCSLWTLDRALATAAQRMGLGVP
jgi:predicted nucleic acid-binding protein